jgi:predicted RNA-binding protein with TRAM domain
MVKENYAEKLKTGDKFILCIEGHGIKGDPFCKINGYVIFITIKDDYVRNNLKKGDVVKGVITSIKDKFAFCEIDNENIK